jgi:hypothetical protein
MSYIQTLSGKKFNYLTATIDDIDFVGIEKDATIFQTACHRMGIKQEYAA